MIFLTSIVINAGPKRRDANAQLIKSAARGAESVDDDVEYVDLYKFDLHGCMNCTICKNEDKVGKCYWRDDVSPLIEKILNADTLLIGTPIFFTEPTSHYRALVERLIYCIVSYETGIVFDGKINVGLFYTLNYSTDYFEKNVRPNLKSSEDLFKMFNGEVKIYSSRIITKREYSQSKSNLELQNKIKTMEEQFAVDLQNAFEIGADLSRN